jgi:hypothetical protein
MGKNDKGGVICDRLWSGMKSTVTNQHLPITTAFPPRHLQQTLSVREASILNRPAQYAPKIPHYPQKVVRY